jgi:uncharacterized protein YqeY
LLARDSFRTTVLRGLKSAVLYAEVAAGSKDSGGLNDEEIIALFQKEAKKRQDAIDLYDQAGEAARSKAEQDEKKIIEEYLPAQLSEAEVAAIVDKVILELGANDIKAMGQVIGKVRAETKAAADGSLIARLVKERLGA